MSGKITVEYENNLDIKANEIKAIYVGQPDGAAKKYVPEKHAKWIQPDKEHEYNDLYRCSSCYYLGDWHDLGKNYCPNCGADMRVLTKKEASVFVNGEKINL